ncbi:MAG: hypothetical protein AAF298_00215 [Cyanobacteria bacterium P01_A01_bin.40]
MNTTSLAIAKKSSQCCQICKDYQVQLQYELEALLKQKKAIPNPKDSAELSEVINDVRKKINEVTQMLQFPPGSWVRNGSNKPGKVIDLVIAGKVPEVHVRWAGSTVPVPERPLKLSLVKPEDLEYVWNGDRFPKLVRRIDRHECDEIPVLKENLQRMATCHRLALEHGNDKDLVRGYQLQITYCKKRIEYLKKPYRDRVLISEIRRNGGTQQRVNLNHEIVKEYAEAMRTGAEFPAVKLRFDGKDYWLTDGFHTTEAAWSIGKQFIEAEITWGTQRDAILDSVGVNAEHGLRRTNADKRKAVNTLLNDPEWSDWSNRKIAKHCRVTEGLIRKIKNELVQMNGCVQYAPKLNIEQNEDKNILMIEAKNNGDSTIKTDSYIDKQDSSTDNQDSSCPSKKSTVHISCRDKPIVKEFVVGQFVQIKSDRSDKRLVGYNLSVGVITKINPASVNIKIWEKSFDNISPNDLAILDEAKLPAICFSPGPDEYRKLIIGFDSKEDIIKAAIAARSLQL